MNTYDTLIRVSKMNGRKVFVPRCAHLNACASVNLHERMLITEDGEVADEWRVAARGWDRETAMG